MVKRTKKMSSGYVVFPARSEDVDYKRILDRGSAVLHAAAYRESVPCAQFETFSLAAHFQVSPHNVNDLIVRMAVHRSSPPFHHAMLGEKKLIVIRTHAAREAGFRIRFLGLVARRHNKVGISFVLRFHLVPPLQRASAARSDLAAAGFRASLTSWA